MEDGYKGVDGFVQDLGATVRECQGCGALIAGGPTRCVRCANEGDPMRRKAPTKAGPEKLLKPEFRRKVLFLLEDGTEVRKGDILWHPDRDGIGWYCVAEFEPEDGLAKICNAYVKVQSPNGAVPTVKIADLRKEPPEMLPVERIRELIISEWAKEWRKIK